MLQIRNIYISEDCKQTSPISAVLKKLNLKKEAPEENGIDLYRRAAASEFVNVMNGMLKGMEEGRFTTLMPELQESQEKDHEIPGSIPEWYHLKNDVRGKHIYFNLVIYDQYLHLTI